jgi:Na+/melibiose symporter-like transporter
MEVKRIATLIAGAAACVAGVLALFGSVLRTMAPPTEGVSPDVFAGLASLAMLILLLVIVLSMPTRPTKNQRHALAISCVVSGVLSVACLFHYVAMTDEYVFTYAEGAEAEQRHLRGELTAMGRRMTRDMTLSEAIRKLGGMKIAKSNQLLWTEQSRRSTELRLLIWYVVALALLSMTLFTLAITLIVSKRAG